jgi:hypothetical protein
MLFYSNMLKPNSVASLSAAFVSVVTLRYYYQYGRSGKTSEGRITRQQEQQQAVVMED